MTKKKDYIYYYQQKEEGVFIKRKAHLDKIFKCVKEDTQLDDKIINSFIEELVKCTETGSEVKFNNLYYLIKNMLYSDSIIRKDYKYYKFILNFFNTKNIYMNKITDEVIL